VSYPPGFIWSQAVKASKKESLARTCQRRGLLHCEFLSPTPISLLDHPGKILAKEFFESGSSPSDPTSKLLRPG
jgi:hypothetical protein